MRNTAVVVVFVRTCGCVCVCEDLCILGLGPFEFQGWICVYLQIKKKLARNV